MATSLIFILLAFSIIFLLFKRVKTSTATLLLTLACFLLIGNGMIPTIMLKNLQEPYIDLSIPQWKNKNAIVLLGAGTVKYPETNSIHPTIMAYPRINEAARLYHACKKQKSNCTIIISGGDALKTGMSEAANYKNELTGLGVKNTDIQLEENSMNTFRNAEFTKAILNKSHYDQVILVSSGIHLKRSLLYFAHFGIHAEPAPADYLTAQLTTWPTGYNFAMADFSIHEYVGIVRYHLYNFMGWNK